MLVTVKQGLNIAFLLFLTLVMLHFTNISLWWPENTSSIILGDDFRVKIAEPMAPIPDVAPSSDTPSFDAHSPSQAQQEPLSQSPQEAPSESVSEAPSPSSLESESYSDTVDSDAAKAEASVDIELE